MNFSGFLKSQNLTKAPGEWSFVETEEETEVEAIDSEKTDLLDAGFRAREDRIKWAPQKWLVILGMTLNTQIGCLGRSYLDYKGKGCSSWYLSYIRIRK